MKKKRNKFNYQQYYENKERVEEAVSIEEKNKNVEIPEKIPEIKTFKQLLILIKANIILLPIIAIIVSLVYIKMFKAQFLNIDDMAGIVQNPVVQNMNQALNTYSPYTIYLALIFKFWGLNPSAYHIGSLVIHILTAFLVFILVFILFGKRISIIATSLFTVHPVNVEAICWLSANGYLHQGALIILNLIVYVVYKKGGNKWLYLVAVALYGLNLLLYRTPWVMVAPFLIILIDQLVLEEKIKWKEIYKYSPFIVFSLIYTFTFVIQSFQNRATTLARQHYLNIYAATPYLNRIPYTIEMVARQYIFPNLLTIYHEGRIIGNGEYAFMIIFTILYVAACVILFKKAKKYAAILIAIPISTLPSLSPVAIAWLIAERYLYLGTVFFCVLIAMIFIKMEKIHNMKGLAAVFTIILFSVYSVRAYIRTDAFVNSKNLWFATEKTSPLSYRVYNNIGDVYAEEGDYDTAIHYFIKSLQLKPDYADAVHNIGYSYMQKGDYENAKKFLLESFRMNPYLYQSLFKLGFIEFQQGNYQAARGYFTKSLEISPGNADSIQYLNMLDNIQKFQNGQAPPNNGLIPPTATSSLQPPTIPNNY